MDNNILLFHQCGFRTSWNLDSFINDETGDFLFLSPKDLDHSKMINLQADVLANSVFDPQYYCPDCIHKNLLSYDFYPSSIIEDTEYGTNAYIEKSYDSAEKCIQFQVNNNFKYIIIPSLYPINETKEFYTKNIELIYKPFINHIKKNSSGQKILLTSIISNNTLLSQESTIYLLNLLTNYLDIDGIYLIPDIPRTAKRIKDINVLYNLLVFIDALVQSDLEVHIGYTDIEGYILSLASPTSLSMGSYENTRRFQASKFENEKSRKSPPNARLYSSKLHQWIDTNYLDSIQQLYPHSDDLFDDNPYKDTMIRTSYNWHFMKAEPYKHFFISYYNQIRSLPNEQLLRYNTICDSIKNANSLFMEMESKGIVLDSNSNGEHLSPWLTVISRYAAYKKII